MGIEAAAVSCRCSSGMNPEHIVAQIQRDHYLIIPAKLDVVLIILSSTAGLSGV